MIINTNLKNFKKQHIKKNNQIIYHSEKFKNKFIIENLIDNFLKEKNSFVFESVEKGKIRGRYTIFGKDPDKIWEFNNNKVFYLKNNKKTKIKTNPYVYLNKLVEKFKFKSPKNLPPLCSLLSGFFSYDIIRYIEKIPNNCKDDLNLPDIRLIRPRSLIIHDNLKKNIHYIVNCYSDEKITNYQKRFLDIKLEIEKLKFLAIKNNYSPSNIPDKQKKSKVKSNISKKYFKNIVLKAKKYIKNVYKNVGLLDMTAFAKCRIKGLKAEEFLNKLVANKLPKKIGRINLCHSLNTKGGVHSEFTIMRESEDSFYLVSAGAFQRLDHDWIYKWMPKDGSVQFENLTNSIGVLVVSGPKARTLMQRISKTDFSNDKFKWLSAQNIDVGLAPCNAMRVNFVGELGWELHHPIEYQNHIFDKLMETGKDLNLKPYGIRAMNSLRVEKSYKLVGTELSIEYSPYESGLDRFIHPNKGDFIGLAALNQWREKGFSNKLVTMEVHGVSDADVLGNNPIYNNGSVVGRAAGGDFGFRLNKSIAIGMVKPELATTGHKLKIDILGKMHDATILDESPYDPENKLLRA